MTIGWHQESYPHRRIYGKGCMEAQQLPLHARILSSRYRWYLNERRMPIQFGTVDFATYFYSWMKWTEATFNKLSCSRSNKTTLTPNQNPNLVILSSVALTSKPCDFKDNIKNYFTKMNEIDVLTSSILKVIPLFKIWWCKVDGSGIGDSGDDCGDR